MCSYSICSAYIVEVDLVGEICFYDSSRKHTYIILTPLNHTRISYNWGLQGYTLFFSKTLVVGTCYNCLIKAVLTITHNLCLEQKYEKY